MDVTVTQEHIDRGARGNKECCPIALALGGNCKVFATFVDFYENGIYKESKPLPEEAQIFIRVFDRGYRVPPLEFKL
jgi:hypothetical protein